MYLDEKRADFHHSLYSFYSTIIIIFLILPLIVGIIIILFSDSTYLKGFSTIIALCVPLIIFMSLHSHCTLVVNASTVAALLFKSISSGARTYSEISKNTKFTTNEIEPILKMCLRKNYLTGVTLYTDKKLILLDTDLNDAFSAPTPVKVEHNKSLTLSCDSCGAKTTAETLENNIIIKCEYCGSIINA